MLKNEVKLSIHQKDLILAKVIEFYKKNYDGFSSSTKKEEIFKIQILKNNCSVH